MPNTVYFPALDQYKTFPAGFDMYMIINNPVTGHGVKILLSDLQPYLTEELIETLTLAQMSDVPAYTNNSYLTINNSGAPTFVLLNTTAKAMSAIDLSTNPNFPAAAIGDRFRVSVKGKVGGASGLPLEVNDWFECIATAAGGSYVTQQANFRFYSRYVPTTRALTFITSPYSVETLYTNFTADTTAGVISFILPDPTTVKPNTTVTVIKIDAAANNVDVTVAGGSTINGSATQSLTTQWESMKFVAMGGFTLAAAAWYKIV